jgi:hypothetical protein
VQPSYSSIGEVFSVPRRYTVPLFQRPYVWSKEEQWQPLWDDIRALAERVLNPPAHKPIAGHFLGTVVLEQVKTTAVAMPQHQVIDGQQRLTTLQLLLKAAEHALILTSSEASEEDAKPIELAAGQVSQLSRNQFAQHAEDAYKVWPTNDDRAAFKAVMDSTADSPIQQATRMAEAYSYFKTVVSDWLNEGQLGTRAIAFTAALKDHLRLIILDLDQNDEPQAIFETLNAHGTPLLPADLIKNWLLWQAGKQELNAAALYESYWSNFDREHAYWRKQIGTGHAARPRVDTFLQNWLTVATGDLIPVKHLYDRFLAHANALASFSPGGTLNVKPLMKEIAEYAGYYAQIDAPAGSDSFDGVLRRLNRLDFVVFRPVLMALLARSGGDTADAELGAKALESFLVRRMVGNLGTRSYGTLALDLVRTVKQVPTSEQASPALIEALSSPDSEWPDDQSFRQSWCTGRFYGWFRRDRVAMLLQAIEERYQSSGGKSEPLLPFDYAKLQIEHIMPQSWAANWSLGDGYTALERDTFVQNIGNLTLVSSKLNPSLSNSAWRVDGSDNCKSAQLAKHSALRLNALLLDEYSGEWNESTIQQRAGSLFEQARLIWPSPSALS